MVQEQGNKVIDLRCVNQFLLYLSPDLPYKLSDPRLVDDTVVWPSEQFISSKQSLGLVS